MIFTRKTFPRLRVSSGNSFLRHSATSKTYEKFSSQEKCLAGLDSILSRNSYINNDSGNYQELSSIMYQIQDNNWWPTERHDQINVTLQFYYQNNRFSQIISYYQYLKKSSQTDEEKTEKKNSFLKSLNSNSVSIIFGGYGWTSDITGALEFVNDLKEASETRNNLKHTFHPFIIQSVRNNKHDIAFQFFVELTQQSKVDQQEFFWMIDKIDRIDLVLEIWKMVENSFKESLFSLKGLEILLSAIIKEKVNVRDAQIFLVRVKKEIQNQNKQKLMNRKDLLLLQTQSKLEEKTLTLASEMPKEFPLKKTEKTSKERLRLTDGNEDLVIEIKEFLTTTHAKIELGWKDWNDNM